MSKLNTIDLSQPRARNLRRHLALAASVFSSGLMILAPITPVQASLGTVPYTTPFAALASPDQVSPIVSENESLEEMMGDADLVAAGPRTGSRTGSGTSNSMSNSTGSATNRRAAPARQAAPPPAAANRRDPVLQRARQLASSGQYQDASKLLFQMSRSAKYDKDSAQIKYILGLMLFEMKLYQSAAFVFYDVVRQESRVNPQSRYLRQSLEKLTLAADQLNSDVLLRYAIKQIKEEEFPKASRDMLYFRTGEIRMGEKDFAAATREFVKVQQGSTFFYRARYKLALALAEANQLDKALIAFEDLAEQSKNLGITDSTRVAALLGRARVLYQKQQFDAAIEAYHEIPRDTEQWHEGLFESTWAMLRDGRFRSALSNFHSLHSTYYEDFYQPESLSLRAIVYLYICKYDEMDRVIGLFERVYRPVQRDVKNILTTVSDPLTYYRELAKIAEKFDTLKGSDRAGRRGFQIPFLVARQVLREGDVRHTMNYIDNLETERVRIAQMPAAWRGSSVGQYSKKIVDKRMIATQQFAGRQIRHHLALINDELRDLFEQTGYLRFEMLSSKKETLRKEIAGKGIDRQRVDQSTNRNYYVQNGYEYWPFTGEYWLDEIGNYHYVGVKSCE